MRSRVVALALIAALAAGAGARGAGTAAAGPVETPSPWIDEGAALPVAIPEPPPPDRRAVSLAAVAGIYVAFSTWAYFAWYHGKDDLPEFTVGGDGYFGPRTYAGGADKAGHAWANHALSLATTNVLRWGGWPRGQASALGSGLSWLLFAFVEIKDGYYYQLSPGDMYANTAGAALAALMVTYPAVDRALDFRVEFWPSPEYLHELRDGNVNVAEDYSGQTYFLSLHLDAVTGPAGVPRPLARVLDYVDVGVGFQTRRYKPDPPEGEPRGVREQALFLGATINLQRVLDRALGGRRSGAARRTHQIGHGLLEVFAPPFSIVPVATAERSPDR